MNNNFVCAIASVMLLAATSGLAQKRLPSSEGRQFAEPSDEPAATLININNFSMWVHADGAVRNPEIGNTGAVFPRGTAGVIWFDGLLFGGVVKDGQSPTLRTGGNMYTSAMAPGQIISKGVAEDPNAPDVRIWRIRRDYKTADLTQDAAEIHNIPLEDVTFAQVQSVRQQYERDWNEWPWQKGAPFYDANANGVMDADEEPGLANADQVMWCVANDLDPAIVKEFSGSPPIGLEMQVTLWAYAQRENLNNMIFKRHRFISKGTAATPDTARIDSMYIGQWSDVDLGRYSDDFVGCDSVLSIGYVYNSTVNDSEYVKFDLTPPAVGYVIVQGPIVPASTTDTAVFDFGERRSFKNLAMTSFAYFTSGGFAEDCGRGSFECTVELLNLLRGFLRESDFRNPIRYTRNDGVTPTSFPLSGDPALGSPEVDGIIIGPDDRRILSCSGPFSLAFWDTQEVIIALVGGLGADPIFSLGVMKHNAKIARNLARSNFQLPPLVSEPPVVENLPEYFGISKNLPNPFNARTQILYELPETRHVRISVHNLLGQRFKILIDNEQPAGRYSIFWDGTDDNGKPLGSGIYFYTFDTGVIVHTKKMILLR